MLNAWLQFPLIIAVVCAVYLYDHVSYTVNFYITIYCRKVLILRIRMYAQLVRVVYYVHVPITLPLYLMCACTSCTWSQSTLDIIIVYTLTRHWQLKCYYHYIVSTQFGDDTDSLLDRECRAVLNEACKSTAHDHVTEIQKVLDDMGFPKKCAIYFTQNDGTLMR